MAIIPVPSSRATELLMQTRLLAQAQSQQLEMLRLQDQLSSGYRLQRVSDDAPAATRAMRLQGLLERKAQARSNLQATSDYLAATDGSLASVSQLLSEVRGLAITSTNSTTAAEDRAAAAVQIRRTVDQLLSVGNQRFRDRYLFGGSRSAHMPFVRVDDMVAFQGNTEQLPSYVDLGMLASANATADQVFGVYSPGVTGSVDLDPNLTLETKLEDLNGGRGVSRGTFTISDGSAASTVDISTAVTIGDVLRLIEENPPGERQLVARLGSHGITVELTDDVHGGSLRIVEVAGGTTAGELGILNSAGTGTDPLVGSDISPRLLPSTRLDNLLGARASAVLSIPGENNDLMFEARERGSAPNGIKIQLVDDSALQAAPGIAAADAYAVYSSSATAARAALTFSGINNNLLLTANSAGTAYNGVEIEVYDAGVIGNSAVVSYDPAQKRISIGIDSLDQTQVQTIIQEIGTNTPFTATYDPSVGADGGYIPTATVAASDAGVVTGNTSQSGGDAGTVFVHVEPGSTTAEQAMAALEANPEIAAMFSVSLDPKDAIDGVGPGQGVVDDRAVTQLAGGSGDELDQTSGLQITNGGTTYTIDVSSAETIEDLLNLLNGSDAKLLAEINTAGTGLNVRSRLSGADLTIGENGGTTATQLGLRSFHAATTLAELNHGRGVETLDGPEFRIRRGDGVELEIDVSDAITVQDVLDAINNHPDNGDPATRVQARLAEFGNGIELINEQYVGTERLTIERINSPAVWDLGLLAHGVNESSATAAPTAATASISFPTPFDTNSALQFTMATTGEAGNEIAIAFTDSGAVSGDAAAYSYDAATKTLTIDIDTANTTAGAVVAAFAGDPLFNVALDTAADPTNDGSGMLGFTGVAGETAGGTNERLVGGDPNPQEVKGVFNTLLRLADAIEVLDVAEIERVTGMLEEDLDRVSFARAELGSQGQFLDILGTRLEDENVELRQALSLEIDTDMLATISNLSGRQAALQASLQLMGRTLQLSLLDYL